MTETLVQYPKSWFWTFPPESGICNDQVGSLLWGNLLGEAPRVKG